MGKGEGCLGRISIPFRIIKFQKAQQIDRLIYIKPLDVQKKTIIKYKKQVIGGKCSKSFVALICIQNSYRSIK